MSGVLLILALEHNTWPLPCAPGPRGLPVGPRGAVTLIKLGGTGDERVGLEA